MDERRESFYTSVGLHENLSDEALLGKFREVSVMLNGRYPLSKFRLEMVLVEHDALTNILLARGKVTEMCEIRDAAREANGKRTT